MGRNRAGTGRRVYCLSYRTKNNRKERRGRKEVSTAHRKQRESSGKRQKTRRRLESRKNKHSHAPNPPSSFTHQFPNLSSPTPTTSSLFNLRRETCPPSLPAHPSVPYPDPPSSSSASRPAHNPPPVLPHPNTVPALLHPRILEGPNSWRRKSEIVHQNARERMGMP